MTYITLLGVVQLLCIAAKFMVGVGVYLLGALFWAKRGGRA